MYKSTAWAQHLICVDSSCLYNIQQHSVASYWEAARRTPKNDAPVLFVNAIQTPHALKIKLFLTPWVSNASSHRTGIKGKRRRKLPSGGKVSTGPSYLLWRLEFSISRKWLLARHTLKQKVQTDPYRALDRMGRVIESSNYIAEDSRPSTDFGSGVFVEDAVVVAFVVSVRGMGLARNR